MKTLTTAFLLLVLTAALGISAADSPRVSRAALAIAEKTLDDRIKTMWQDNPLALVGATRGIYLDGYGAVFTAEVNPISGPLALFHGGNYTKDEIARYHKTRGERVPQLVGAMKQNLMTSAASLDAVLPDEQIVIAVILDHNIWEDVNGLPARVVVQAPKKKLLEAQRAGASGASLLDAAVKVTEN